MTTDRSTHRRRQSDIAVAAGVSQATVSMVLNGRTGKGASISPDTRERVLRAAAELGYSANPAARSLAGGRNHLLGVFTFDSIFPTESASVYHPFLVGVEREAEELGYDLVLFTSSAGPDRRRSIYRDSINRLRMADGGILLLSNEKDLGELDRLAGEDFPFVLIGRREVPGRTVAYVAPDYVHPSVEVLGHLAELGHRRIAHLGSGSDFEPCVDRLAGFDRARELYGFDPDPALRLVTSAAAMQLDEVARLFEAGATALVAEDERILARLLMLTDALGLRPPHDFSVVSQIVPVEIGPGDGMTGLRRPWRALGAGAVRLMVEILDGRVDADALQVDIPCDVVIGDTIGPPPATRPRPPS